MYTAKKTAFESSSSKQQENNVSSIVQQTINNQYTSHQSTSKSTLGNAILQIPSNPKYISKLLNELPLSDISELTHTTKRTFLHIIAEKGDVPLMKIVINHLLQNQQQENNKEEPSLLINVNAVDTSGWTALHLAVSNGFQRISKLLIKCLNANVNAITTDQAKWSPIHLASSYGHAKLCEILLEYNANVNELTGDKYVNSIPLNLKKETSSNTSLVHTLRSTGGPRYY